MNKKRPSLAESRHQANYNLDVVSPMFAPADERERSFKGKPRGKTPAERYIAEQHAYTFRFLDVYAIPGLDAAVDVIVETFLESQIQTFLEVEGEPLVTDGLTRHTLVEWEEMYPGSDLYPLDFCLEREVKEENQTRG